MDNGIGWHAGEFSPWAGQRGAVTEDTVGMRLDLSTGSLEVTLNGESLGVMEHVRTALLHYIIRQHPCYATSPTVSSCPALSN